MNLVLTPAESRVAESLVLTPRNSFHGRTKGERLTTRRGISIDFSDYREYSDGDDLRHLDWNVLARLDTPIVKTYRDEQDLNVVLALDASQSMGFGEPETKLDFARRVTCAVGMAALCAGDSVTPVVLGRRPQPTASLRGRGAYPRLAQWASRLEPGEGPSLAESLRMNLQVVRGVGLWVIVSDCLDPELAPVLKLAAGRGHEVYVVQTLGPEDLEPDLEGDLSLVDADGQGAEVETTATASVVEQYKKNLFAFIDSLSVTVRHGGGRHLWVATDSSLTNVLTHRMLKEGWVA